MSNLENLTAKIIADSNLKANKIIDDARKEAEAAIAKSEAEANAEKLRVITGAAEEAKRLKDLMLSAKNIENRDKKLAAKQQTINGVIEEAKSQLKNMDKTAFEGFVWKYLSSVTVTENETIRVPEKYALGFDIEKINKKLAADGKPELKLDTSVYASDGFKLVRADAENDFSFDALVDYYRAELEQTVVERVFR